jgi:hypothetical protein
MLLIAGLDDRNNLFGIIDRFPNGGLFRIGMVYWNQDGL